MTSTSTPSVTSWQPLTLRLMLAQALVLLVGLVLTLVTVMWFGPSMFVHELAVSGHAEEAAHVGEEILQGAFRTVSFSAVIVGGLPALVIAVLLSFYLYRTIGRSLTAFSSAAEQVASGDYQVQLTSPGLGPEFDTLASSFSDMAARLSAVDTTRRQMLADLAHEMRTPLASINAHVEAIEDGVLEMDEEITRILYSQTGRLERLAGDIRLLAQAEEGLVHLQLVAQYPAEVVAEAVASVQQEAASKDITLITTMSGLDTGPVLLDRERIGQVLGNLLVNALRHTPATGSITVHTDHAPDAVTIAVTDTGDGIAAEHLSHIFDRFYRARAGREAGPGSGLGLSISRALVEAHGGRLQASSAGVDRGASFELLLPRSVRS
ncbi:sensor histidine kinase [Crystallibacter degradans]|uniref:sensor histidine kinase n=1 Tax=Crystallibacter degradans TaxID=2726743 RepID=UPI001F0D6680|nr:HAMP domain-containing sensor histidine kinase [Arthrobacter sp. SF27]